MVDNDPRRGTLGGEMLLATTEAMEAHDPFLDILISRSGSPKRRYYPMVEMLIPTPIFVTEIIFNHPEGEDEDGAHEETTGTTMLIADFRQLLQLLEPSDSSAIEEIHLLSKRGRDEGNGYSVSPIVEIIEGTNEHGDRVHEIRCEDGSFHDTFFSMREMQSLKEVVTLYVRDQAHELANRTCS